VLVILGFDWNAHCNQPTERMAVMERIANKRNARAAPAARFGRVYALHTCKAVCCAQLVSRPPNPPLVGVITHAVLVTDRAPTREQAARAREALEALCERAAGSVVLSGSLALLSADWIQPDGLRPEHVVACTVPQQPPERLRVAPRASAPGPSVAAAPPGVANGDSDDSTRGGGRRVPQQSPALKRPRLPDPPPAAGAPASERARVDASKWACQPSAAPSAPTRNHGLASAFEQMAVIYKGSANCQQDTFRAKAFGQVAKLFLRWRCEVTTPEQFNEMVDELNNAFNARHACRPASRKGTGKTPNGPSCIMSTKVVKYCLEMLGCLARHEPPSCKRLRELLADPQRRVVLAFTELWGVGVVKARQYYAAGYRSVDALCAAGKLEPKALCFADHASDFATRIPRAEVEAIGARVRAHLLDMLARRHGEGAEAAAARVRVCDLVGSYRRGRADSSDADVLICLDDETSLDGVLRDLVAAMAASGFVTEQLTAAINATAMTFMGVCRLHDGALRRRLDVKIYPLVLHAYALLYFTGSEYFNRSMRHYAKRCGYSLSDKGLVPRADLAWAPPPVPAPCACEQDVFDRLGLRWVEPEARELATVVSTVANGAEDAHAADAEVLSEPEADYDSDAGQVLSAILAAPPPS
jgi:hypothetical protein